METEPPTVTPPTPPAQRGRPKIKTTYPMAVALTSLTNFWVPYRTERNWRDVRPELVDSLHEGVMARIDECLELGCTWAMISGACGQHPSGTYRWYQRHNAKRAEPRSGVTERPRPLSDAERAAFARIDAQYAEPKAEGTA